MPRQVTVITSTLFVFMAFAVFAPKAVTYSIDVGGLVLVTDQVITTLFISLTGKRLIYTLHAFTFLKMKMQQLDKLCQQCTYPHT